MSAAPVAARARRPAPPEALEGLVHRRALIDPVAPYRLPFAPADGVIHRRGGLLERIAAHDGEVVLLRAARPHPTGPVLVGCWAPTEELADHALERWRRTLGVDVDHRPFLALAWDDPVLGPLVRRAPGLRPTVRYRPHEALLAAICGQLIEFEEALRIERGLTRLAGVRCERTGLRDAPTPQAILDLATAQIESTGLSARRALLMRQVCRLLVRGLDLDAEGDERAANWRRLRAIPGLGSWTLASLALRGQGETDASPSGDLGLLKSIGRHLLDGRVELTPAPAGSHDHDASGRAPRAPRRDERGRAPLATEQQVHEFVTRFSPWSGYAAEHLLLGSG